MMLKSHEKFHSANGRRQVLIVDDEPINRELLGAVLETDYEVFYAADGAECYHEYKCKFAFASSQRLTTYEAYYLGFKPCNRCKPPIYDPTTGTVTFQEHDDNYDPS